ncbi:MAG: hypothetical protein IKM31_02185 [Oscillospiraceae bacterium]|nr:hypothetical protein [Oscillospiraceae bacterium]
MKLKYPGKHLLAAFGAAAATAALTAVFPPVFVRNMGGLIRLLGGPLGLGASEVKQFSAIFDQLKEASVLPPLWLAALVLLGGFFAALRAIAGGKRRRAVIVTLWILLLLPLAFLSLWFTHVNDLRFGIVISALIRLIAAGAF